MIATKTTGSDQRENRTYNKYQTLLTDFREQIIKKETTNKGIKVTPILKKHKTSGDLISALIVEGIIERRDKPAGADKTLSYLKWTYLQKDSDVNEVDSHCIQKVIDAVRKKQKDAYDRHVTKKKEQAPQITEAYKLKVQLNEEKVEHQIKWLQNELSKEAQVPGYLREGTLKVYPELITTLTAILEMRNDLGGIMENLVKLNQRISK